MHPNHQFILKAIQQALKSPMTNKHGAILIQNHKIIQSGFNHNLKPFIHKYLNIHLPATHAEIHATRTLPHNKRFLQN